VKITKQRYQQDQEILFATEFTEDTEEASRPRIMAFLSELCVLGGNMMLTI